MSVRCRNRGPLSHSPKNRTKVVHPPEGGSTQLKANVDINIDCHWTGLQDRDHASTWGGNLHSEPVLGTIITSGLTGEMLLSTLYHVQ